jgi:hypothetical protein
LGFPKLAATFAAEFFKNGGLAQLVERLHGMQEVIGSNPLSSTKKPCFETQNKAFSFVSPLPACVRDSSVNGLPIKASHCSE